MIFNTDNHFILHYVIVDLLVKIEVCNIFISYVEGPYINANIFG